jgi:glycerophosphoryl diester phosphodiesterase
VNVAASVEIFAHRGASFDAPENTLAAFKLAYAQGADGAEGDFYLSKDGKIVCVHDDNMKKTAGVSLKVAGATLAELKKLDVGSWKHRRFAAERVPTLLEVLAIVPKGKKFLIEVKCGPEIVPQLEKDVETSGIDMDQLVVIAFDSDVVAASRKAMPKLKAYWLTSWKKKTFGGYSPSKKEVLTTLKRTEASGLDAKAIPAVLTADYAQQLKAAGFELHCWTVNDAKLAKQMIAAGVQSLTTDRPAWLRDQLEN